MTEEFLFSQDIADQICEMLQDGATIRQICALKGFPSWPTVRKWKIKNREFATQYAHAYQASAEALELRIIEISLTAKDKDSSAAARTQIEALKWIASKRDKGKYGDKLDLQHTGEMAVRTISDEQLVAELNAIIAPRHKD